MPVLSNWKITWDPAGTPLVLLDYDQEMEGEIDFPWEQAIEERRVIEGDYSEPLPRGWVKGGMTIAVWKEHADDAAARDYLRTHRATINGLAGLRKTLRVTPLDGTNDDKANTVLASAPGRMLVTEEKRALTLFTYAFRGPW